MPSPSPTQITTNTTPNSCVTARVNVRSCLSFDAMWKAHPLNWASPETHPFKAADGLAPLYEDQCAIKISIALQNGGLAMNTFKGATERRHVTQLNRQVRAALRAEEVAKWLSGALGVPEVLSSADPIAAAKGRTGVIFFKDFWTRTVSAGPPVRRETVDNRSGDHIDLWNGKKIPAKSEVDSPEFSGGSAPWAHYFRSAKAVWLWELR